MKGYRLKKEKVFSRLCLAVNLFLYAGFALLDGPVWCRDSNSYATMDYTREPVYCTFLWLMRKIFGESILVHGWDLTDREGGKIAAQEPVYLMAAIVCQAVVMAIAVWYLAKTVYRIGRRSGMLTAAGLAVCANLVMWGVDVLNRFGAKRGSAYFQSIMTEGFGIPFYILFLLFLYRYLSVRRSAASDQENRDRAEGRWKKYLFASAGMMVLCTSHHKQLGITILIYAGACFLSDAGAFVKDRRQGGKWITTDLLALAAAGMLIFVIGHGYNLVFHGVWSFHTGSADKIDSTLLYTASAEDAELFDRCGGEDAQDLKELFLQIEEELTAQKLRYADVMGEADSQEEDAEKTGWVELCSHYADSYDIIGFNVLDPLTDAYVREHHAELEPGTMAFAIETDKVCQELEKVLLHQNLGRLFYLWINNVRKGFVNTVLRVNTVLNWASLVLWIVYLALSIGGITRCRHRGLSDSIRLAGLTLLGTLVNCMVVGAIIFPQTRYMIYNMGLFYVCLLLLMADFRMGMRGRNLRR
jgi:hypothetical protein